MTPRYRSYTIRVVSKDENFQLEVADVPENKAQMLIATDLLPRDGKFVQEAYGLAASFSETEIDHYGQLLIARLRASRTPT